MKRRVDSQKPVHLSHQVRVLGHLTKGTADVYIIGNDHCLEEEQQRTPGEEHHVGLQSGVSGEGERSSTG